MSIINRFRNFFASGPKDKADENAPAMELDEIWQLTDKTDFLIAINERLNARSSYGEHLEQLSSEEQVFYICNLLEEEVNNGGFDQFLYNSSGNYAHRVEECLRTIGANKTADICHVAFAAFGKPIPQDRNKREKFLDKWKATRYLISSAIAMTSSMNTQTNWKTCATNISLQIKKNSHNQAIRELPLL